METILHVDMDAFYASVEEREAPELRGKPLIVGGTPAGRGVVAAANYAAREFGIHSAMPTATALRKCPHARVLPPRIDFYSAVSAEIHEILNRFTPIIEPLSLDEAFLDVRGSLQLFGSAQQIAEHIKTAIKEELGLVASVGVATNKYLAKLASDLEKPNGLVVVPTEDVMAFLAPLPIRRIWGIGRVTEKQFDALGIQTIGDIQAVSESKLRETLGELGSRVYQLARGLDDRPVVPDREAKSISHETTFGRDVTDHEMLQSWLMSLTEQVARRLRRSQLKGRTVQLKVRYSDFKTITRSKSIPAPSDATDVLWQTATQLLNTKLPKRRLCVRLLGIGVSNLSPAQSNEPHADETLNPCLSSTSGRKKQQNLLFETKPNGDHDSNASSPQGMSANEDASSDENAGPNPTKQETLDNIADQVAEKFGAAAIRRARGAQSKPPNSDDQAE